MTITRLASRRLVPLVSRMSNGGLFYKFCSRVVSYYNGDNLDDMTLNGECRVIQTLIRPDRGPIFDVGANRGDWACNLLCHHPFSEMHCFEPSPYTFRLLQDALESQKSERLFLNNMGLGVKDQTLDLHCYGAGCGTNSFINRDLRVYGVDSNYREPAQITSLDRYCSDRRISRIEFLKIDVEGYELEVLQGGEGLFREGKIGTVQFEYGGTYLDAGIFLRDVFEFFEGVKYRVYKITPQHLILFTHYDPRLETFQCANFLAVREGVSPSW